MRRLLFPLFLLVTLAAAPAVAGESNSRDVLSIQRVEMPWTIGLAPGQVPGGLRLMSWTAFRGSEALTAPQFAEAVDDRRMIARLTTERRVSGVLGGILSIGSATSFIVGGATLANLEQYTLVLPSDIEWGNNQRILAYTLFGVGSILAVFAPTIVIAVHMKQLWVGRYYTPERAAELVDEHNDRVSTRAPPRFEVGFGLGRIGLAARF